MAEQDYTPAPGSSKSTAASRSGQASGGSTPDSELKKLKETLAKDQGEADKLKKEMEELQAKIKGLEKAIAETGQVTSGLTSALQAIATDRLQIVDFLANDLPQLEKSDEVKGKKAEIDAKIKEVDAAIESKDSEWRILVQRIKDEKTALQTATDDQAAKKQALDSLKNRPKVIQDKFATLKKLRQRIDTEGAGKPLIKYALALELKRVWDETKDLLVTKEQLEAAFYTQSEELRAATATATAQEQKVNATQAELETSRKELDARRNSRLDDVLKGVGELTPKPTASGAGTRTAAAAASAQP